MINATYYDTAYFHGNKDNCRSFSGGSFRPPAAVFGSHINARYIRPGSDVTS